MIGDSQWIEGFLYKVMVRAAELINQQAHSFRDSLERWLALNWPVLMLPGWEQRFNNFLRDWRANGVILQDESAQQLFDYLNAHSEQMRADAVQLPERPPTWQSLLPTREEAMRPADERHFPDDLPAPFDPAYPQLRRTGNSIMQRDRPEDWLRRAEQALKHYRVPKEIAKQFLAWIAAEQKKRTAPAVQSAAGLESLGPSDLHPYAICFAAGTTTLTRCGPIAIEQVVDGDEVLAVPETDPLAPARWCRVERAYHNNPAELINIHVAGLPIIRATLNHPFFVRGKGFMAAQRLRSGDLLLAADDRWLPVSETFRDGAIQPVYNLCVAECHTYFAGGVLVHNQSPAVAESAPPPLPAGKLLRVSPWKRQPPTVQGPVQPGYIRPSGGHGLVSAVGDNVEGPDELPHGALFTKNQLVREAGDVLPGVTSVDDLVDRLSRYGNGTIQVLEIIGHSPAWGAGIILGTKNNWFTGTGLTDDQAKLIRSKLAPNGVVILAGCNTAFSETDDKDNLALSQKLGRKVYGYSKRILWTTRGKMILEPGGIWKEYDVAAPKGKQGPTTVNPKSPLFGTRAGAENEDWK